MFVILYEELHNFIFNKRVFLHFVLYMIDATYKQSKATRSYGIPFSFRVVRPSLSSSS